MEDVTGWYSSSVRQGVYTDTTLKSMSAEFEEWLKYRAGRVVIQKDREFEKADHTSSTGIESYKVIVHYPKTLVYFEKQEDLVEYLLTFDILPTVDIDIVEIYCPYIPLPILDLNAIASADNYVTMVSDPSVKF